MAPVESQLKFSTEQPISSVKFAPKSNELLLVSSWDSSVSLFHVPTNTCKETFLHGVPVLDAAFQDSNHIYSGGLNGSVKLFDVVTSVENVLGFHSAPVKSIEWCKDLNSILSGGWDKVVHMWDPRTHRGVGALQHPDKVYTMSVCGNKLIVGTKGRKICIWDLRYGAITVHVRESSLKYQTRCIKASPDNQGFVMSSIEGRVAVEYFDISPEIQKNKYAFKCHRNKQAGVEYIYPVNTISFHRQHKTFATGGSDGVVNIWDSKNKKRLVQFHQYPTSITSVDFSHDGLSLAIACSFLFDDPIPQVIPEPSIFIRNVGILETKPKQ